MPRLADVCYALIYPAITTIMGIAYGSADGVCHRFSTGGRFVPIGMDVMDCGPQASIVSLSVLFTQFKVLPSYWGDRTILKNMGVFAGSTVMNFVYAFQTELLVEVGIPLVALWLSWELWRRLTLCWACIMQWYKCLPEDTGYNEYEFDKMCMTHCKLGFPLCKVLFQVLMLIYFLVFFALGVYWINMVKELAILLLSLDFTIPELIVAVVLLRKPDEIANAAGAAAVSVMLAADVPRSDELSA